MEKNDLVQLLRELEIEERRPTKLKNAGESDVYFNLKKAYGDPYVLSVLRDTLWDRMRVKPTCVAAEGYGGIPLATTLAEKYCLRLTMIREHQKEYGNMSLIESHVPGEGDAVAIIDDVLTTGKSLNRMICTVRKTGAAVLGCYVVINRSESKTKLRAPLYHLVTADELVNGLSVRQ